MPSYTQVGRPLSVYTVLGPDVMLASGFSGTEGLSSLFNFTVDTLVRRGTNVAFDKLLGQPVVVRFELPDLGERFYHGLCNRITQGETDEQFTSYRLELVPAVWLLTKRAQSRIFQAMTVPEILIAVLTGPGELQVQDRTQGPFLPRDYCVQYRESDFAFASRLMEEEGIYYYFEHGKDSHAMVLADRPDNHPDLGVVEFNHAPGTRALPLDIVTRWDKSQEMTAGQVSLWDHCFEMPGKHLETSASIPAEVKVGGVTHSVRVGDVASLELYDYPGEYAQRFDGIDSGGGDRQADLKNIFKDKDRTAKIRAQQVAVAAFELHGGGTCRSFTSGYKFTLQPGNEFFKIGDPGGTYVLTHVKHYAEISGYRTGTDNGFVYRNEFMAIPFDLPYRPQRTTLKPVIPGPQTAEVVGPKGEEINCDKYGRVKVQFHWDRQGKYDLNSSCWVRVATIWAGQGWGVLHVPRIGHEVVVVFEDGDPDRPLIIGSVYNAHNMPPGQLPKDNMVSGARTNTTPGGGGFNGMVSNDTKGKEMITLHAQYDMDSTVEHNEKHLVNVDRSVTVHGTFTETIDGVTKITITKGTYSHKVATGAADYVFANTLKVDVTAAVTESYGDTQLTSVKNNLTIQSTAADVAIKAKTKMLIYAGDEITLLTGSSSLVMQSNGTIVLSGKDIKIVGETKTAFGVAGQQVTCDTSLTAVSGAAIKSAASGKHDIMGTMIKIN